MEEGIVQIFYGPGKGKSSAALGNAIRAAGTGKKVYIVQFLKSPENPEYMARLEPEIKIFRFERSEGTFSELSDEEKQEEKKNIENGLNFAKKALTTGECDVLVLDEILGVIAEGVADVSEVTGIVKQKSPFGTVVLTGRELPEELKECADEIMQITAE
ncbi:MAG: cob(I)yrinic acid a,c-diamide adenosyltransferase [Lachnospiraceae bacterium]|nr:cob(I)yrinic acid a,c-diamide adenosyltransferase [Lachnospiraceae bacterium]